MKNPSKMIKGFVSGSFDLLHAGHILMFKEIKKNCNYLIVGLNVDPTRDRPEKNKPVESIEERIIRLEGCKYVDEIIPYYSETECLNIIENKKPDVRFLGEDYKDKKFPGDDMPIEFIFIPRRHNYSSSNLRKRICQKN